MKMGILIITGTFPPEKCGVGDFTYNLLNTKAANEWELFYDKNWSIKTLSNKIQKINQSGIGIINLQYPSMGFGYSIVPHLLCIYFSLFSNKRFTVTFHEFSRLGKKSKIASILFLFFSWKIIFTNQYEREAAIRYLFSVKYKSSVIKIHSNIKPVKSPPLIPNRKLDLGYFGFISPLKGLEDFLFTAKELLSMNSEYKIYIMGQTQPEYELYYTKIINIASNYNITLYLNKPEDFVSKTLSDTKICYLPYPDGISERRGSFLAVILNLCLVHTTKGKFTTRAHESFCTFSEKNNAASIINTILNQSPEYYIQNQNKIRYFIKNEIPQSWEDVALQYSNTLSAFK